MSRQLSLRFKAHSNKEVLNMKFRTFGTKQNVNQSREIVGAVLKAQSDLSSKQYLNKLRKNYTSFLSYLRELEQNKRVGIIAVIGNRAAQFSYAANKVTEASNDKDDHNADCSCAMCRKVSWGGQLSKSALEALNKKFNEERIRKQQFKENFDNEDGSTDLPRDIVKEIEDNSHKVVSEASTCAAIELRKQTRKPASLASNSDRAIAIAKLSLMIALLATYYNVSHPANQAERYREKVLKLGRQIAPNIWRYRDRDYQVNNNLSFKKVREQADFSKDCHVGYSGKDNPKFQARIDNIDAYEDHRENDMRNTTYSFEQLEKYGAKQGPIVKECTKWWRPSWAQRLDAEIVK